MVQSPLIAGVIGHPIGHSRSPILHGHWLDRYGIDGHYVPLDVAPGDLATALRTMPKMGFAGVNVTIPHKEAVLDIATQVTDRASLIGSANTLTFGKNGQITADNTDGIGFISNLRAGAPSWDPKAGPVVVLGAGGAARGVLSALLTAGVPEIRLSNRTTARAEVLRQSFGAKITIIDWNRVSDALLDATLLVNTTSLGMTGQPPLRVSLERLPSAALVTDIVYTPLMTGLLREAQQRGNLTVDGLGMLLHQAVPGFERWFGVTPTVDNALRDAVLNA